MHQLFLMILGPLVLVHLCYIVAVIKKDFSLLDTVWGLGFIALAVIGCLLHQWQMTRENLVCLLVTLWGVRLAGFIFYRNHGKPEDFRYAQWRKDWGEKANVMAYFKVYLLQFFLLLTVSLPIFATHYGINNALTLFDYLGILLWFIGVMWEAVGDYQKHQFKSQPHNKNQICQEGLWFYSRHPNYFGEALLWWGIALISLSGGHYWGLLGSLFLNFLLLKVSGVPLVEKRYDDNPQYQEYKSVTPTLIPNLLKSSKLKEIL